MTVALSLLTAFAWTAFNYWIVPITKSSDPFVATMVLLIANALLTVPIALVLDGIPSSGDLLPLGCAVLAGVLEALGFVLFFRALRTGDLAVVAPIVGLSGGIAALAVIVFGENISVLIGIGIAISLVGGCLAASQGRRRTAAGALPAAGTALCLGFMFALYAAAADLGPVSAVSIGRLSALVLLGTVVVWRRLPLPSRAVSRRLLALGAIDAAAFVSYAYAAARGPVSVAAVVVTQFSTLSAVVGIVLLRERLRPHQYVGILLAGAGTALLALAQ
jgi:drug/metabolite transporter (DMT)-like permease